MKVKARTFPATAASQSQGYDIAGISLNGDSGINDVAQPNAGGLSGSNSGDRPRLACRALKGPLRVMSVRSIRRWRPADVLFRQRADLGGHKFQAGGRRKISGGRLSAARPGPPHGRASARTSKCLAQTKRPWIRADLIARVKRPHPRPAHPCGTLRNPHFRRRGSRNGALGVPGQAAEAVVWRALGART